MMSSFFFYEEEWTDSYKVMDGLLVRIHIFHLTWWR